MKRWNKFSDCDFWTNVVDESVLDAIAKLLRQTTYEENGVNLAQFWVIKVQWSDAVFLKDLCFYYLKAGSKGKVCLTNKRSQPSRYPGRLKWQGWGFLFFSSDFVFKKGFLCITALTTLRFSWQLSLARFKGTHEKLFNLK